MHSNATRETEAVVVVAVAVAGQIWEVWVAGKVNNDNRAVSSSVAERSVVRSRLRFNAYAKYDCDMDWSLRF
jgi:hypothetical protein